MTKVELDNTVRLYGVQDDRKVTGNGLFVVQCESYGEKDALLRLFVGDAVYSLYGIKTGHRDYYRHAPGHFKVKVTVGTQD